MMMMMMRMRTSKEFEGIEWALNLASPLLSCKLPLKAQVFLFLILDRIGLLLRDNNKEI